jgi:hypothetical protein
MCKKEMNGMKSGRMKIVWSTLALIGVGAVLAGCGQQGATGATQDEQAAKDRFLAERSGGTPVVTDTVRLGPGGRQMPGVMGAIDKIEGNIITVKSPFDDTSSKVQLADDAKLTKQAEGALSEIKVGDSVTAVGAREGETLQAEMLRIGGAGGMMMGGGPIMFGGPGPSAGGNVPADGSQPQVRPFNRGVPGGAQGAAPGGRMLSGEMPEMVSGTVEEIEGSTMTLKDTEGKSTTVEAKEDAIVLKQVEIDPSELKVGETIVANGTRNGDVLEATQVQVMPDAALRVERP